MSLPKTIEEGTSNESGGFFGSAPWLLVGDALVMIHDRASGRVVDCNERTLDLLGITYTGGDPVELDRLAACPPPFDRDALEEKLNETRAKGSARFVWHTLGAEGRPLVLDMTTQLLSIDGISRLVSVSRDVTDAYLTRAALERAEAFLTEAIGRSPTGIILSTAGPNPELRINAAAVSLLGACSAYDGAPVEWVTCTESVVSLRMADGSPYPQGRSPLRRALLEGEVVRDEEATVVAEDGETRWLLANAAPVHDPAGQMLGAILVISDLTRIKRDAEQRATMQAQLIRAQRLESLALFGAGVAHEMNNPLMTAMNYSDLITMYADDPARCREYAEAIVKACQRMRKIVTDLGTVARPENVDRTPLDFRDLVGSAVQLFGPTARRSGVKVEVDSPTVAASVHGNAGQLIQVLASLMQNATLAMNDLPTERTRTLSIATAVTDDTVTCRVKDTGPGMSAEVAARAFDPFFTTRREFGHAGLGLSVSRSIVSDHGGELRLCSEPGEGTEFIIALPHRPMGGEGATR